MGFDGQNKGAIAKKYKIKPSTLYRIIKTNEKL